MVEMTILFFNTKPAEIKSREAPESIRAEQLTPLIETETTKRSEVEVAGIES